MSLANCRKSTFLRCQYQPGKERALQQNNCRLPGGCEVSFATDYIKTRSAFRVPAAAGGLMVVFQCTDWMCLTKEGLGISNRGTAACHLWSSLLVWEVPVKVQVRARELPALQKPRS